MLYWMSVIGEVIYVMRGVLGVGRTWCLKWMVNVSQYLVDYSVRVWVSHLFGCVIWLGECGCVVRLIWSGDRTAVKIFHSSVRLPDVPVGFCWLLIIRLGEPGGQ